MSLLPSREFWPNLLHPADQIAVEGRTMEAAVEKKETEQEEQQLPHARKDDAPAAAEEDEADSEETERRNRDLKAGLHPLRVRPRHS